MKGELSMNSDGYKFAQLSNEELKDIHLLEEKLSEKTGEEVVLIAYKENDTKKK